jgi:hypothetical protein
MRSQFVVEILNKMNCGLLYMMIWGMLRVLEGGM